MKIECIEIDRYASPEALAWVSGAPEIVCRMVFAAGLTRDQIQAIRSNSHRDELCRIRHAITWAAREYAGATFTGIGKALNRDQSVATRCYNRAKLLLHDRAFRNQCDKLRTVIGSREELRLKARVQS